ncbi:hypothetical protein [Sporofaciens sp. SGI.106]|uniref:hypothetical protein n=1 Tax=Sporofaciens sp. SGI.106 TaxID=3420568 RepID=UPI003D029529
MEIKYKLYPYPVLSSYSNDYATGAFDVTIDIIRDGYDLRIDFLATLTCQSLQDCIKQGTVKYVYHLECPQTSKNDEVVEYSMGRTMSPMMVAEYQLQLPDKDVLQKKS